ncbi:MAG: hypothetical protein SEPTF4163_000262 [Sporothrix epigloea]
MEEQPFASSAVVASDQQHQQISPATTPASTGSSESTALPPLDASETLQTSANSTTLRFPKPEGSNLLAHWVTSSSTGNNNVMQASNMDETNSLADSAYELISSTDGESQDGREPDSLAASITSSFNIYPRADDVVSLSGNEVTYDDEDDGDDEDEELEDDENPSLGFGHLDQSSGYLPTQTRNSPGQSRFYNAGDDDNSNAPGRSSPADSIRYAEQALCSPSTQSLSKPESTFMPDEICGRRSLHNQSIEFDEGKSAKPLVGKVLVKHTIREFSEGESAIVAANMGMAADHPRRMAAMICQTMSRHSLLTREPLRVLYVGSDAAFSEIMHKISSAILASGSTPSSVSSLREHQHASNPGIYNIMPISSFGSAKVPEIDEIQLMGVSDFYIKVDRCVKAEETAHRNEAFFNDHTYSIELESGQSHVSVSSSIGSTISPSWTLPHVAIFYVSGNDTESAETTRNAAWEFMTRHAVPSIFISHSQSFSRSPSAGRWQSFVDHSAIHLCLESRDFSKPIPPQRLPIDLTSFLNIDARQMNRNLAYLTGLKDKTNSRQNNQGKATDKSVRKPLMAALPYTARSLFLFAKGKDWHPEARNAATTIANNLWELIFTLLAMAVMGMMISIYSPLLPKLKQMVLLHQMDSTPSALALAKTTAICDYLPTTPTTSSLLRTTPFSNDFIPVVTLSYTTTKTTHVPAIRQMSSANQIVFGGYLTDNVNKRNSRSGPETKITGNGCLIEVHSSHEILVRVPAATKTKWLAKGAIDIDVWQGQNKLWSKLSTTDEGIIIELNRRDAVGVMNVSIVTARRPKINETFAVDFGEPFSARLLETGLSLWRDIMRPAVDASTELVVQARKTFSVCAEEYNLYRFYTKPAQAAVGGASWLVNWTALGFTTIKKDVTGNLHRLYLSPSVDEAVQEFKSFLKERMPTQDTTERLSGDVRLTVLRAQVASKLWWLRAQGKTQELYRFYTKPAQAAVGGASWLVNWTALGFTTIKKDVTGNLHRLYLSPSVDEAVQEFKSFLKERMPTQDTTERLSGDIRLTVLRAQVASKLWWLRAQGKTQEYSIYEEKAAKHIRQTELIVKAEREKTGTEASSSEPGTAAPSQTAGWLW